MDTHDPNDELERVKAWWKAYGGAIVTGVVIGVVLLAGVNFWRSYKGEQAAAASQLYDQVLRGAQDKKPEQARTAGETLLKDYSATPYAGKAALVLAKIAYDAGDSAGARKQLQWAIDNAREEPVRHVARLRLARILISANELQAAGQLLNVSELDGFVSEYQDLRGDLFLAEGKTDDAKRAYQAARDALPQGSPYSRVLDLKLDDLGQEKKG